MRRIITGAVAALVLGGTTACASAAPQPYSDEASPRADEIVVHVTNHNFDAVTVRALTGGQDIRLGTVETDRESDFVVPPTLNRTDLRLAVVTIGSDEQYVTQPLSVTLGSTVDLDVNQSLDLSNVTVR
jgi:hypothetical protein